jgi:hypothetical protein
MRSAISLRFVTSPGLCAPSIWHACSPLDSEAGFTISIPALAAPRRMPQWTARPARGSGNGIGPARIHSSVSTFRACCIAHAVVGVHDRAEDAHISRANLDDEEQRLGGAG